MRLVREFVVLTLIAAAVCGIMGLATVGIACLLAETLP